MNAELSGRSFEIGLSSSSSWSGQRWPSSTYNVSSVPTDRMRQGDFSQLLNGASPTVIKDPLTGNAFGRQPDPRQSNQSDIGEHHE